MGTVCCRSFGLLTLGGVAARSLTIARTVLLWASFTDQWGKSEGRQIPGTKQTKKSRNVGWAFFPPELLVTCHLLISWLSLVTQYHQILSEPHAWAQCELVVFTLVWTLSTELSAVGAWHLQQRLLPHAPYFHLLRDLLSLFFTAAQQGKSEGWRSNRSCLEPLPESLGLQRAPLTPLFAVGFCSWPCVVVEVL